MATFLPTSMKAVVFDAPGQAAQLYCADLPLPIPLENEVLVQVVAAGINRPDVLQRQGLYPSPPDANPRLGLEVSGRVIAVGAQLSSELIGQEIMALVNGGGYAEYVAVPWAQCMPIPQGVSLLEAASLPETYLTVWQNLVLKGGLQAGQTVLIHGGSSGIGSAAIQLAKSMNATVIATAGTQAKLEYCLGLGADLVVNYRMGDFSTPVLDWTQGRGVDLVLDMVAGDNLDLNLRCLATGGQILIIALLGGRKSTIDVARVLLKQAGVHGTTLRAQSSDFKAGLCRQLTPVLQNGFSEGHFKITIDSFYALSDVVQAHLRMESREHCGKIVLKVSE